MIISKPPFTRKLAPIAELPHLERALSAPEHNAAPAADFVTRSNSALTQSSIPSPSLASSPVALSDAPSPFKDEWLKLPAAFPSIDPFTATFDERGYAQACLAKRNSNAPKAAAALHGFTEFATGEGLAFYQALYDKLEIQSAVE